eukprot:EC800178.1.p1 GENE.EC800178.1~~EC800178.1.p1  ORF type:complete len:279 (+),score=90.25 EC800178.1:42-878(+)
MGCAYSQTTRLAKAKKQMTDKMPVEPEQAVRFTNSEKNPCAVELAKCWRPGAIPKTFENDFVKFDYPPEEWSAKNESALETKTETHLGVNIRLSVELLELHMTSQQYCDFVNEQVATILHGVKYTNEPAMRKLTGGQELACVRREWEMPTDVKGTRVNIPLKQLSLHGTTHDPDTGDCVAYNCTISAGSGIWELFKPIFEKFLNNLQFKDPKLVAECARRRASCTHRATQTSLTIRCNRRLKRASEIIICYMCVCVAVAACASTPSVYYTSLACVVFF